MILSELKIENFRNYALEHFEPDPELNLICGLNAQGKSNLLESICYLGLASSFRGAGDNELIRWEQPYFYVEAEAESKNHGKLHISAAASRKRQKRWTLNHQPLKRLSEAVGLLHCVVFAPEDVLLVKAGPDLRRRYLNRQMSQLDREYCRLLMLL